jgi:hypothetical protein
MAIHREFTLTGPDVWARVIDTVRPNAAPAIERGKPLHVIVTSYDADRHDSQIGLYWGVILKRIAEDIPDDDGEFRPAQYWHERLALEFLGMIEWVNPRTNRINRRRRSTARGEISVGDMAKYLTQLQAWGAERGIVWD